MQLIVANGPSRFEIERLFWGLGLGLFLAAVGAMDTEAAPWLPRILYWLVLAGLCWLAIRFANRRLGRWPGLPDLAVRIAAVTALLVPMTGLALFLCIATFGGAWSWARLGALVVPVGALLGILQLPFVSPLARPRRAAGMPALLRDALPAALRDAELRALHAQDHYVQVHTDRGRAMVRMRFADAVAAASLLSGSRVHRSWWVAAASISETRSERGREFVILADGGRVPISRRFRRCRGRLHADSPSHI